MGVLWVWNSKILVLSIVILFVNFGRRKHNPVHCFINFGKFQVFEVISWATSGTGVYGFWVIFDMLNVLRALAVFIIFVCKRDIIFALEENYPCLKRRVIKVLIIFSLIGASLIVLIISTVHTTTKRATVLNITGDTDDPLHWYTSSEAVLLFQLLFCI